MKILSLYLYPANNYAGLRNILTVRLCVVIVMNAYLISDSDGTAWSVWSTIITGPVAGGGEGD